MSAFVNGSPSVFILVLSVSMSILGACPSKRRLRACASMSCFASIFSSQLGSECTNDRQCKVDNSHCNSGICSCKHYHAQLGTTECLESKLLGRECLVSEQCSLRVANSTCRNGHCHCSQGFIRFRKHTCLGPARPGDVCYSDEHCRLWSRNSHCKFLIPKLFGKCMCDGGGICEPNEGTKPPVNGSGISESNKSNSTEIVPISAESNNEGEVSEQINEGAPEESKNPQKANPPFVDPFLHQKEHLQESPSQAALTAASADDSFSTTIASVDATPVHEAAETNILATAIEEAALKTEKTAPAENYEFPLDPQPPTESSKYRVETSGSSTNSSDVAAAVSLGYPCQSDVECERRDRHSRCVNGVCDCLLKSNSTNSCSRENTGCGPETFQCRESGICISWFFVCDGRDDCSDKSDEECRSPKCSESAFQCEESGTCVSLAVICDGVKNCPNGEDERFCSPDQRNSTQGCPEHTFQCANGQCLPKFEFCNAIPKCSDGSDEFLRLCSSHQLSKKGVNKKRLKEYCPFECGNGRCRSTAIVCSGRDGCGDNSDEAHCSVCNCPQIPTGR